MFGSLSFVPLFVQAVLGTSATDAGSTLMPLMLSWVAASVVGSRILLRIEYRTLAVFGMVLLTLGAFCMALLGANATRPLIMLFLGLMGAGMGFSISPFLIAVQSKVARRDMGTATSTLQFSRSIGGTVGVSVLGAVLSVRLATALSAAGLDPAAVSLNSLLDPLAAANSATLDSALRGALAVAMQGVFTIALLAAALGLVVTALAPGGRIVQIKLGAPADDKSVTTQATSGLEV
jgi:hypothetical protein